MSVGELNGRAKARHLRHSEPAANVRTARAKAAALVAPPVPKISYSSAVAISSALGLEALQTKIQKLSPQRIARAIAETERRQKRAIDPAMAAKLRAIEPGTTELVPIDTIRPGQLQISYANVRTKTVDFLKRIDRAKGDAGAEQSLLAYDEALTAIVGPGGKYLVLVDGHHHIAALKAVDHLVEEILGRDVARAAREKTWKPGREIQRVHDLFHGELGAPAVPIKIVGNMSAMSEREFWKSIAEPNEDGKRFAYLVDRKGRNAKVAPRGFGELEDNPFRNLAAVTTGKVRTDGKKIDLGGADFPVWLKLIDKAPPFIEFELARVLEAAFQRAGKKYDPTKPLTKDERTIARAAIHAMKRDDVPVVVRDVPKAKVAKQIEVDHGAIELAKNLRKPSKRRLRRWEALLGG